MARVKIVTDSTSDIPSNLAEELGIEVVPLNVHFGDKVYRDGIDLTNDQFYEMLAQSAELPKTSQPSAGDFDNVYSRYCDEDQSIASIHISSKLSGTLNSAQVARENFKLRCHIDLFDTLSTSMGLGLIAMNAARAANDGADRTEIADLVRKLINNVHIYFFVDTPRIPAERRSNRKGAGASRQLAEHQTRAQARGGRGPSGRESSHAVEGARPIGRVCRAISPRRGGSDPPQHFA